MRLTVSIPILTSAVLACGGNGSNVPPDASPDAPEPDAQVPGTIISLDTFEEPDLVAFRDGKGPWQSVAVVGNLYDLEVHGPYVVAVVCDDGAGFIELYQFARTLDDNRQLEVFCIEGKAFGPGGATTVTGTMAEAGVISLDFGTAESATPDWSYELTSAGGIVDLVAHGGDRAVFRRNLEIAGPTTLPRIDLAQEGFALVDTDAAITNPLPGETLTAQVTVFTQNFTFARFLTTTPEAVQLIPDGTLIGQERQRLHLRAIDGDYSRSAFLFNVNEASATSFALPDPLSEITFTTEPERIEAEWTTIPAGTDLVTLLGQSFDNTTTWLHTIEASASYVEATGATHLAIDTAIPGFDPRWRYSFDALYFRQLGAHQFVPGSVTLSANIDQVLNLDAPPRRRPLTRDDLRARRYSSLRLASRNLSISAK